MIKQRIVLTEIPEVECIRYMRSHNSGNIHSEKFAYLSGRTKKVISRKLKYILTKKKTTPQLLIIGLQNIKVGVKSNFDRLA